MFREQLTTGDELLIDHPELYIGGRWRILDIYESEERVFARLGRTDGDGTLYGDLQTTRTSIPLEKIRRGVATDGISVINE